MQRQNGFTTIEIIIAICVIAVLGGVVIADFISIKNKTNLDSARDEFSQVLRTAQGKSLGSENAFQYGVYINTGISPNQYVLFKGPNYSSRDITYDQIKSLPVNVQFYVNLGGASEIDFERLTGASDQSGIISLTNSSGTDNIYISNSGTISLNQSQTASDTSRQKDSRHIQFDYSRTITFDTAATPCTGETINLYFDGASSPQQQIPVCSNIVSGQISWQGKVSVGGASQTIGINTHRLNSPDTQFSIHRDRSLNTKSLRITISGDSSGNLINYSADGLTTNSSSIYVSNSAWQ